MHWLTLSKLGLILNTFGAVLLAIGSDKVVKVLTQIIDTVREAYGNHDRETGVKKIRELVTGFQDAKRLSNIYNRLGYCFFAAGFILQLI